MSESGDASWLIIDGYEDEPAAFGVPPYVDFTFATSAEYSKRKESITNTALLILIELIHRPWKID